MKYFLRNTKHHVIVGKTHIFSKQIRDFPSKTPEMEPQSSERHKNTHKTKPPGTHHTHTIENK